MSQKRRKKNSGSKGLKYQSYSKSGKLKAFEQEKNSMSQL